MSSINDFSIKIKKMGVIDNGCSYNINIGIPTSVGWIEDVNFKVLKGCDTLSFRLSHIENKNGIAYFGTNVFLDTRAIYNYYFTYYVNGQTKYIKKDNANDDNYIIRDEMWKMSVNFEAPEWAKGAVMYHIFVDRFCRSGNSIEFMPRRNIYSNWDDSLKVGPDENGIWNNDFYGGNLKGIISKLDYIQSLGVDIIYLSPIVTSQSNHRYDTGDYENVDPYVGNNSDLILLCDEVHKRGMKIILDAVFNHTGNDSKYFNEYGTYDTIGAYQSIYSTYSSFYKKHLDCGKIKYDFWWGMPNLPVCNGYSLEWINYITGIDGVIDKWFSMGIDGLRLDVADELNDSFIEFIRKAVKRNKKDGFILGEVWKNPMRMNRGYIESGKGMDSVMNYSLIDAMIRYFKYSDSYKLGYIIGDIKREYPTDTINTLMNFTSTHDISRAINIFGSDNFIANSEWAWDPVSRDLDWSRKFKLSEQEYLHGKELYKAYIFALTFMPGILSIFYGDEVGLQGMGNLYNRKSFPWGNEDKDLVQFFKYIGEIRRKEKFLKDANIEIIDLNNDDFIFKRENNNSSCIVAVNRTSNNHSISLPQEFKDYSDIYSLNNSNKEELTSYGGVVLVKK